MKAKDIVLSLSVVFSKSCSENSLKHSFNKLCFTPANSVTLCTEHETVS